jgi:HK97 family phage major capsid protein
MPSARDGMPGTLFGYPIFWNEHCPLLGSRGDIGLYDFKMYLVGDRQGTTIDAS